MIARAGLLVAVLAVAGCTVSHQVFGDDDPITTCEQVWLTGAPGDPCELAGTCERDAPTDPMCCIQFAYCRMGELVMDTTCNPDCATCADDHACAPGSAVCNGMACEPCPPDPSGGGCTAMCPPGWATLTRNGCPTCECAPPSECTAADGTVMCDPNGSQLCYPGARYADQGCAPDDLGCTANVCSEPGCPAPAPLGCFTACDITNPTCGQCATDHCECDPSTGSWSCTQICIDQYPQSLTCFL